MNITLSILFWSPPNARPHMRVHSSSPRVIGHWALGHRIRDSSANLSICHPIFYSFILAKINLSFYFSTLVCSEDNILGLHYKILTNSCGWSTGKNNNNKHLVQLCPWFWYPNCLLNRKMERFKVFKVQPRLNRGRTVMTP